MEPLGSHALVTALARETRVVVQAPPETVLDPGTRIGLSMLPEHTYFLDAETSEVSRHRERISLQVPAQN